MNYGTCGNMNGGREASGFVCRMRSREKYLRRVFAAYAFSTNSQLSFWHETPSVNEETAFDRLGQYYMPFTHKAHYPGPFDDTGVPLLDYHGEIGRQYYSIAIAQYALANYNLFKRTGETRYLEKFISNSRWLLEQLAPTSYGTYLWATHFDFEYYRTLKAPWYSGLAQGQGLSVLARAYAETGDSAFLDASHRVFESLCLPVNQGGALYHDPDGHVWIEEYIIDPPTHILNGFLWALWGVYDYVLLTGEPAARELFESCVHTITRYLPAYDSGFWSYYELTPQRIKSIASPFYHRLHIVQLNIMHRMTGITAFESCADRWQRYLSNRLYGTAALLYKVCFKLMYY